MGDYKQKRGMGVPGQRNNEQYKVDLPPVNFQKNSNVVSNPNVDDLKTK